VEVVEGDPQLFAELFCSTKSMSFPSTASTAVPSNWATDIVGTTASPHQIFTHTFSKGVSYEFQYLSSKAIAKNKLWLCAMRFRKNPRDIDPIS
jgi:hypothetical protein